jgi:hypothetical protein
MIVAFGYRGHRPSTALFAADHFDGSKPEEKVSNPAFFCYFYSQTCTGGFILFYFILSSEVI